MIFFRLILQVAFLNTIQVKFMQIRQKVMANNKANMTSNKILAYHFENVLQLEHESMNSIS